MSEMPSHRRRNIMLYVFGALGGLLFGYDTGVISGAILFIEEDFRLNPTMEGVVVSAILVGAMIGAVGCGRLADRLGRRVVLLLAGVVFCVGSLGAAFAPSVWVLALFRVIIGVGVGTASVSVPLYLSEMAPTAIRGSLTSLNQLMITVGILVAYAVDYALAPFEAWRWMLGLGFVPAVVLLVGMYFQPETPRWLVRHDRGEQARAVLAHTRRGEDIDAEIAEIQRLEEVNRQETHGLRTLVSSLVRPMLIVGVGLAALQQLIGINTIIYYAPTTLTKVGLGPVAAVLANVGIGVVNVGFTFVAIWLLDKVGRKPLLLVGNVGMVISLAVLGVVTLLGVSGFAAGVVTLVCLAVFIAFFAATWGPIVWVMLPEIFPLSVRGGAVGVSTFANWAANFVVALTFPIMIATFGIGPVFLGFAGLGVLAFFFVQALVPETKGRSLEDRVRPTREAGGLSRPG